MQDAQELIDSIKRDVKAFPDMLGWALAVAFADNSEFVRSHDEDPVAKLESLQTAGGLPIALVVFTQAGARAALLEEYAEEEWAQSYIHTVNAEFARAARKAGIQIRAHGTLGDDVDRIPHGLDFPALWPR
jgi:hypothetical protein